MESNIDLSSYKYDILCFTFIDIEWSNSLALLLRKSNFPELMLILGNILLKSQKQALSMLWSEDYTTIDYSLWQTWQNASEICDEF